MSGSVFVLAGLLVGQVTAASDAYGASGQDQVVADEQSMSRGGEELVPVLQPPPSDFRSVQDQTTSSRTGADPYGAPVGESGSTNSGSLPASPFDRSDTSSAISPPPGFGGISTPSTQLGGSMQPDNTGLQADTAPANYSPSTKPSALIQEMLAPPAASRLSGRPITLDEAVAGAASRTEQSQRIAAYWDLCSSVAEYYLGLGEQDELRRLRATVPRAGAAWEQAEQELAVRIGPSERAARASQYRLASWLGGSLPLPGDMPHCGSYQSHYDQIFAGRPSAEAQQLSELLPLRYAELKDAALAVSRAKVGLNTIESVRHEESDGTGTLRAWELWALRRRAFIQIVRDYNRRITRYSKLATPGQLPAERLISMLILRNDAGTAARTSNPASSSNDQRNGAGQSAPRTFSGGWSPAAARSMSGTTRDDAVEPASGELENSPPRRERSLLVKPQ